MDEAEITLKTALRKTSLMLTPVLLAAAMALASGCGLLSGEPEAEVVGPGNDRLNDQLQGGISGLDPATARRGSSSTVLGNVGEGLYRRDENGEPVPGMAESVEVGGDRLQYTFTLREGIQWSNGEPVTAQDFEYAWLRAMDPDTGGNNAYLLTNFIENGEKFAAGDADREEVGVKATGERSLEVTLGSPAPFFLDLTTLPVYLPLKESFVRLWGEEFGRSTDSLLYNGPYKMTGFDASVGARLEKREGYWDAGNVGTQTIDARAVAGSGIGKYESGELDVAILGPRQVPKHETEEGFEQRTDFATFSLYLNDDDPALGNLKLRKAVQAGFDRDSFVEAVLGDGATAAYGYIPYGMSSGSGGSGEPGEPGKPDESDESGSETFREAAGDAVPDTGTAGARRYWERGTKELGREPALTILTSHEEADREAGAFLQDQLEESLGARVEVEIVPPEVLLERQESGEYQILATRERVQYDDPASYLDPRSPSSPLQGLRPVSPRYEKLMDDARKETDPGRRAEMLVRAERILVREKALVAPVFFPGGSYLVNPAVKGYATFPYGSPVDYRHVEVER
jgi:oligopeptide transport system substrate-binding protein